MEAGGRWGAKVGKEWRREEEEEEEEEEGV